MPFNNKSKTKINSLWDQNLRRFLKNKFAVGGLFFIIFMLLFSFIGPFLSPYLPDKLNSLMINKPPSLKHWMGTDQLGRDILTRLMFGGRISLTIGIASMTLSVIIGTIMGSVSGFYGGIIDSIIMRLADILMSIPSLPLLIILSALMSEWKIPQQYRLYIVMLMLSLVGWPGLARLIRGQILSLKEQSFMDAAEVLGLSDKSKIFSHLIPNTIPLLIVIATLGVAGAILTESALSFLGLGVTPPTASWGNMIDAANSFMDFQKRPWLWMPPGAALLFTVISINLMGDGLRDALDPKMKR
jgi:peptide/nickel transport system permease protein